VNGKYGRQFTSYSVDAALGSRLNQIFGFQGFLLIAKHPLYIGAPQKKAALITQSGLEHGQMESK
jgi:hypothetical protein